MDNFAYRSRPGAGIHLPVEATPSASDQAEFSTLKETVKVLKDYSDNLGKDFNAFKILDATDPDVAARNLLVQVMAKKEVHALLSALIQALDTSISAVANYNSNRSSKS